MITAGVACLDVTPPLGTMIPGSFDDRFAEKVRDPLHVRSFVVEREGEGVAVVVCDLIGVKRDYLDRAKERIAKETELIAKVGRWLLMKSRWWKNELEHSENG